MVNEVCDFLNKCGTYYLATTEGNQPRVRPFGTAMVFENKLYFQTGKSKNVSKQILSNPKIEICGATEGKWIRIEASAFEDERLEPKQRILDAYPVLKGMYQADDGNTQVFYLKDVIATLSSFTEPPRVMTF